MPFSPDQCIGMNARLKPTNISAAFHRAMRSFMRRPENFGIQ
jgi:hypothetical protein